MIHFDMTITDILDNEQFFAEWFSVVPGTATEPKTFKLVNNDTRNTTANLISAVRGDFLESIPADEDEEISKTIGSELVDESWLEARIGTSGAWTVIDSWANKFDLGAVAAGASIIFQVRINAAIDAESIGNIGFAIRISTQGA